MLLTIIVLDSVGLGELPDAAQFGDQGSHTVNHTLEVAPVHLPNLAKLGLGRVPTVNTSPKTIPRDIAVQGGYGRMLEVSGGKDSSTGHWEFVGIQLEHPFKVYPNGFPAEVMEQFDAITGRQHLCNQPYSGTQAIKDFGAEHRKTGAPIVYTSADSVFQIAAHVDVVPLEQLYEWSEKAREMLQGPNAVARVIARPFQGTHPFERLHEHRKDYSLVPPDMVLNAVQNAGIPVIGIGKIPDIYADKGITEAIHTDDNADGIQKTLQQMRQYSGEQHSLIFTNLVDFDSKFGHRRDPQGYSRALAEFDAALPDFLEALPKDGALILTSDHGNDPTWLGTDHTREHGMLLAYRQGIGEVDLGLRNSFADIGATAAEALGVTWQGAGESFWTQLN